MAARFDASLYTTVPTRSAAATLGLAQALLSVAEAEVRPAVALAERLQRLRDGAERLQRSWVEVGRCVVAVDLRRLDRALDQRWTALRGRLYACVLLGDEELAPRAEALLVVLFPTGLDFLKLPYIEEWAQSERRLALVVEDGLEEEIGELCGEPYLPRLRAAHEAYGEALGVGRRGDAPGEAARVLRPLEELKEAIVGYARGVIGGVSEGDLESVGVVERVLEPIVRARRAVGLGEVGGEEEEPETLQVEWVGEATASP